MMQQNVSLVKYTTATSKYTTAASKYTTAASKSLFTSFQVACCITSAKSPTHVEKI